MIKNKKMKLEEAIKTIKSIIYDNQGNPMDYIDISFSQSKDDIGAEEFIQAIDTVLQELNNLQEKNQTLIKYIGSQGMINDYMRYKNSKNK